MNETSRTAIVANGLVGVLSALGAIAALSPRWRVAYLPLMVAVYAFSEVARHGV
jgi:hypothetical protein